jgi:hypothetical protein
MVEIRFFFARVATETRSEIMKIKSTRLFLPGSFSAKKRREGKNPRGFHYIIFHSGKYYKVLLHHMMMLADTKTFYYTASESEMQTHGE